MLPLPSAWGAGGAHRTHFPLLDQRGEATEGFVEGRRLIFLRQLVQVEVIRLEARKRSSEPCARRAKLTREEST